MPVIAAARGHRRVVGLDGLRGLAVLLVVGSHVGVDLVPFGGVIGVTLFFVLSGYLITGLLMREQDRTGTINFSRFYIRRVRRLAPAALIVLAVTPLILWAVNDPALEQYPGDGLPALFYFANYMNALGFDQHAMAHMWSLSVEEQFYFIWPVTLLGLTHLSSARGLQLRIVITVMAGLAACWTVAATFVMSGIWVLYSLDTNAFALLLGASLAAWRPAMGQIKGARIVSVALFALFCVASILPDGGTTPSHDAEAIAKIATGFLGVLAIHVAINAPGVFAWSVLRWFGSISYGLYLWNFVLLTVRPDGEALSGVERLPAIPLAILLSWLSWRFIERPILDRGNRVTPPIDANPATTSVRP